MWGKLSEWLLAITGPVATKVLTTLGLGVVSYTGFSAVLTLAYNSIQTSFNGLPSDAAQFLFLSGAPQAMAIILSALSARVSMMALSKLQVLQQ